ncbi:Na+/H+ antiporter subunit E [Ancylobacter sp. VNQ12]|uniref:Na+/H+ antiporter subunit E n=1 Tax=Ancylobacter sp. VNQ12 TaxID=3400920 RepID=UPI003C059AAC
MTVQPPNSAEMPPARFRGAAILGRAAVLYLVWVAMAGTAVADLAIGVPAAALATYVSLKLLPPGMAGLAPGALLRLSLGLPVRSLIAGIKVARLALGSGRLEHAGIVACPLELPPGVARETFLALASLQPGSLPVEEREGGTALVQVIDARDDIAGAFAQEQRRFAVALRPGTGGDSADG